MHTSSPDSPGSYAILPFQTLSTRARREVVEADVEVTVCVFAFDIIWLNGASLMQRSLRDRRSLLAEHFNTSITGEFELARCIETDDADELRQFLRQSLEACAEGLMCKQLDGPRALYSPSKRADSWIKVSALCR